MSSVMPVTMSPDELIFTFKQGGEESFKEAWERIFDSYSQTEPQMTMSLLLKNFYFGLVLCHRYALDAIVGGDFLHCDGDQAFNAIKKLVTSSTDKSDSSLKSIYARLNTLETDISHLKEGYNQIREYYDHVPVNFKSSMWVPIIKVVIGDRIFHAHCDTMSEFCLMPKTIYESLNLWGLAECGEKIFLTNNTFISPIGTAEGVFTKFLGRTVSTDYLVIKCAGTGQITLGRSILKLVGAIIDMGKGNLKCTTSPQVGHTFPKPKSRHKGKKSKHIYEFDASSLGNT